MLPDVEATPQTNDGGSAIAPTQPRSLPRGKHSKRDLALGLVFLAITIAAWIAASFITQLLVTPRGDGSEDPPLAPWLLTLLCSSMFVIYLPAGRRHLFHAPRLEAHAARKAVEEGRALLSEPLLQPDDDAQLLPAHTDQRRAAGAACPSVVGGGADRNEDAVCGASTGSEAAGPGGAALAAAPPCDKVNAAPRARDHAHQRCAEAAPGHAPRLHDAGALDGRLPTAVISVTDAGFNAPHGASATSDGARTADSEPPLSPQRIWVAALMVAPLWLAAQCVFAASLAFTTVTSNTVLSSSSSLFVYLGGLMLREERATLLRAAAVAAAMAGTALVAFADESGAAGAGGGGGGAPPAPSGATLLRMLGSSSGGDHHHHGSSGTWHSGALAASGWSVGSAGVGQRPLLGDGLTLLSAALYAAYTLLMRRQLRGRDDGAVAAAFFGALGVLCSCVLVPVWAGLWLAGSPAVRHVTGRALALAALQGLIDYVAADYCWARAVLLLGPTATSCGLALQIPAAGLLDAAVNGKGHLPWSATKPSLLKFLGGTSLILAGFIGVSLSP